MLVTFASVFNVIETLCEIEVFSHLHIHTHHYLQNKTHHRVITGTARNILHVQFQEDSGCVRFVLEYC